MPALLARGDVLVKRASARLVTEAARSTAPLRALERATIDALAGASGEVGDELLLIRKLEFAFLAVTDGSPLGIGLREAMRSAIRREIGRAQRSARGGADDVVLYRNEAEAVAGYLVALREGAQSEWPHRLFASWGDDWDAAIGRAVVERGRQFGGDVLAEVFSRLGWSGLLPALSRTTARLILSAWSRPDETVEMLDLSVLPPDLLERLRDGSTDVPEEIKRAACLARLFVEWPPARAMIVDLAAAPQPQRAPASRIACKAGGLAYWLVLMHELGIDSALEERFPETRVRRAARQGLAQALQAGGVDSRDPAVLLFAGEEPDCASSPHVSLAAAEAAGLQELALSVARHAGLLSGHVRLVELGEATVVLDGTIVVDTIRGAPATSVIGRAVLVYRTFAGAEPRSVDTEPTSSADIDVVREVDVAPLPEPWRLSVRVMGSVLRTAAVQRRIEPRDTYGWTGSIVDGVAFELLRRDIERVAGGNWASSFPIAVEQQSLLLRVVA